MCIRESDHGGHLQRLRGRTPAWSEPAEPGVGKCRFASRLLHHETIVSVEKRRQLRLDRVWREVRAEHPDGVERTRPGLADAHEHLGNLRTRVGGLGEVIGNEERACHRYLVSWAAREGGCAEPRAARL